MACAGSNVSQLPFERAHPGATPRPSSFLPSTSPAQRSNARSYATNSPPSPPTSCPFPDTVRAISPHLHVRAHARPAPTPHATCTPRRPGRSPPRPPLRPPPKPRARTPPPSFPASARRLAASPRQTLRMPRQPADRTARATWPACPAVPALRQPEPAKHAPRLTSAPVTDVGLSRRPQGLAEPPQDVLRGLGVSPFR